MMVNVITTVACTAALFHFGHTSLTTPPHLPAIVNDSFTETQRCSLPSNSGHELLFQVMSIGLPLL